MVFMEYMSSSGITGSYGSFGYFPSSSAGKEFTGNAGDPGSIPESGRSAGEGIDYPLQYSWASLAAQLAKNLPAMWETWFDPWVRKGWRRERPAPVFWPGEFHRLYSPWVAKSRTGKLWGSLCPTQAWSFIWPNSPQIFILLNSYIIAQTPSWWPG